MTQVQFGVCDFLDPPPPKVSKTDEILNILVPESSAMPWYPVFTYRTSMRHGLDHAETSDLNQESTS